MYVEKYHCWASATPSALIGRDAYEYGHTSQATDAQSICDG